MNNLCTSSAIVLLQDLMPLVSTKDICPGTRLTQYYQSWWLGHEINLTAQQNTVGHKKGLPKKPLIFLHPKTQRSLTISQLCRGWFSQERRPKIKFLYQRVEAHSATKERDAHIYSNDETPWYLHFVKIPHNVNSVEPPLTPQKQSRTAISNATNDNHQLAVFMKAQRSRISIRYSDQPTCQMPRACDYNISICASIHYKWKLSQKQG
jgi:hypothetical protein